MLVGPLPKPFCQEGQRETTKEKQPRTRYIYCVEKNTKYSGKILVQQLTTSTTKIEPSSSCFYILYLFFVLNSILQGCSEILRRRPINVNFKIMCFVLFIIYYLFIRVDFRVTLQGRTTLCSLRPTCLKKHSN